MALNETDRFIEITQSLGESHQAEALRWTKLDKVANLALSGLIITWIAALGQEFTSLIPGNEALALPTIKVASSLGVTILALIDLQVFRHRAIKRLNFIGDFWDENFQS